MKIHLHALYWCACTYIKSFMAVFLIKFNKLWFVIQFKGSGEFH